jgi:hypothetical protein
MKLHFRVFNETMWHLKVKNAAVNLYVLSASFEILLITESTPNGLRLKFVSHSLLRIIRLMILLLTQLPVTALSEK